MNTPARITGLIFSGFAIKGYAICGALYVACLVAGTLAGPLRAISATLAALH